MPYKDGFLFAETSPLHGRDVVILVPSLHQSEYEHAPDRVCADDMDAILTHGFVRGLQTQGLPVRVLHVARYNHGNKALFTRDVEDLAMARTDTITMTDIAHVIGLERRVVVTVADKVNGDISKSDYIHMWACCTSQLIVVNVPRNGTKIPKRSKNNYDDDSRDTNGRSKITLITAIILIIALFLFSFRYLQFPKSLEQLVDYEWRWK
jgi:hypothetical protein